MSLHWETWKMMLGWYVSLFFVSRRRTLAILSHASLVSLKPPSKTVFLYLNSSFPACMCTSTYHLSSPFFHLLLLLLPYRSSYTWHSDDALLSNRTSQPIWPFRASSCTTLSCTKRPSWKTDAIRWLSGCAGAHGHNSGLYSSRCECVCVVFVLFGRLQVLLDLASLIFEEQQCLEVLLRKFAGTILSFMQAQACTVFIADEDSMVSTHKNMLLSIHVLFFT